MLTKTTGVTTSLSNLNVSRWHFIGSLSDCGIDILKGIVPLIGRQFSQFLPVSLLYFRQNLDLILSHQLSNFGAG